MPSRRFRSRVFLGLGAVLSVAVAAGQLTGGTPAGAATGPPPPPFTPTFTPVDCPVPPDPGPAPAGAAALDVLGGTADNPVATVLRAARAGASPTADRPAADPAPPAPPGLPPAGTPVAVRCGRVTVPLEHRDPGRGTIEVGVAVVPALVPTPGASPLMMLAGGPGQRQVEMAAPAFRVSGGLLDLFHATRDLILIDQRGVGFSRPVLDCPEYFDAVGPVTRAGDLPRAGAAGFAACHDRLVGAGIDLSAFDTYDNVRDVDLVRRALGYDRLNLYGGSYGARLGLQVARTFGDRLDSVVLESSIPAERNFLVEAPTSYTRALRGVADACAADAACHAAYPDVAGALARVADRYTRDPQVLTVDDPAGGPPASITIDTELIANRLYQFFYQPGGPALLPYVITRLDAGDVSPLRTIPGTPTSNRSGLPSISEGMQVSFMCAEEAAYAHRGQVLADVARSGPLARALWRTQPILGAPFYGICRDWDVDKGSPETFRPIHTDVPVFVASGQFDQITPPAWGEAVARSATGSTYVEVPGAGHGPLSGTGECGLRLIVAFVDHPHDPLDTTCARQPRGFASPEAAGRAFGTTPPRPPAESAPAPAPAPAAKA